MNELYISVWITKYIQNNDFLKKGMILGQSEVRSSESYYSINWLLRLVIYCQNSDSIHIRHHVSKSLLVTLLSKIRHHNSNANSIANSNSRWPTLLHKIRNAIQLVCHMVCFFSKLTTADYLLVYTPKKTNNNNSGIITMSSKRWSGPKNSSEKSLALSSNNNQHQCCVFENVFKS